MDLLTDAEMTELLKASGYSDFRLSDELIRKLTLANGFDEPSVIEVHEHYIKEARHAHVGGLVEAETATPLAPAFNIAVCLRCRHCI